MRIEKLDLDFLGIKQKVYIYRDDLFPYYYGGNKARKMLFEKSQILEAKAGSIITTGGIQSNHCRVTALLCAEIGIQCHLVLHGNEVDFFSQKGNAMIMRDTGAKTYFVNGDEIGSTMDRLMVELKNDGKSPYYLYGGGHTKSGFLAYVHAVDELFDSVLFNKSNIKSIYLASGTGSTQAGIIQGIKNKNSNISIKGISIARSKTRGIEAIIESFSLSESKDEFNPTHIDFNDEYLLGGYGKNDEQLMAFIDLLIANTGILFDSTYSGKAFYGMVQELKVLDNKDSVLFWHTGGQFNKLT